jgi:TolB-like protein
MKRVAPLALAVLVGCATNPSARRTTLLNDADRAAKAAVEREAQLDVAKIPARTLAVLPFNTPAADTVLQPLRFGLAVLLGSDLSTSPALQMVERLRSDAMLRELRLIDEGRVDPSQGPRVGRLIGARRLLIGDVARGEGNSIRLSARVVDVLAGTVQQLVSAEAPIDQVIDAEKALALLVFERLGIVLTPAQRTRVEQKQSTQLAALIAFGKGAEADAQGDAPRAVQAYEEAVRRDGAFKAAKTLATTPVIVADVPRVSNLARVLDLGAQAINLPPATRTADVANAPIAANSGFSIVFTVRVTP